MSKKATRKLYREKRNQITASEKNRLDDLLLIRFQTAEIPFIHALFSYWPIEENNEPNTHLFSEFLKFRNPELLTAYPVADFATINMTAIQADIDTPFIKTNLDIYEPQQGEPIGASMFDMVFVPLLAFDKKGYRIGYGKGFYDKYLQNCREDCLKVGFSYFEALETEIDREEFDVPLDLCITPQSIYVF